MPDVLSQSQIDELLKGLTSGDVDINEVEEPTDKVKEYDFRSPKRITKENIKIIRNIYENYSRMLASYLSAVLRMYCDITVEQVEETGFNEFINAFEDYVLIGLANVEEAGGNQLDGQMLMQIPKQLSFLTIDRLMGGDGSGYDYDRDYTDIEIDILGDLLEKLMARMGDAWKTIYDVITRFDKIETNPRMIQSIDYNEIVLLVVLTVTVKDLTDSVTICIPSAMIDAIFGRMAAANKAIRRRLDDKQAQDERESILKGIKESDLIVSGILGMTELTLEEILDMHCGDVIMLDRKSKEDIDVQVEGETWFTGKLGSRKNKNVIKLNKILY